MKYDHFYKNNQVEEETDSFLYLFIEGRSRMIPKNFFRISCKAASVTVGLSPKSSSLPMDTLMPDSSENTRPFVATLFFFRNAAEKPEAHTCNGNQIFKIISPNFA